MHEDNHTFLFEKQIFNLGFFEAVKEMYETLLKNKPEEFQQAYEGDHPLFTFMERLVFELIPLSSDNKPLIDMTKLYVQMLQNNYNETLKLIHKRVLMKEAEPKREYFEILVSNLDASMREVYATVLLQCVNQCFVMGNRELIDEIMNQVFACMPDDLCKNWLKVHQFLWVSTLLHPPITFLYFSSCMN